ncbi:hypothetical protein ACFQ2B_27840 [Streptomyces stramineus]
MLGGSTQNRQGNLLAIHSGFLGLLDELVSELAAAAAKDAAALKQATGLLDLLWGRCGHRRSLSFS